MESHLATHSQKFLEEKISPMKDFWVMVFSAVLLAALAAAIFRAATGPALPPCQTEDSVSCHWQADSQGNGQGRSFDSDSQGNITYTD